jgi:hypothetical protein
MVQPDIIRSKAAIYGIDLNDPSGLGTLRTCKRMLEDTRGELSLSHKKVIHRIDKLEEILLGVKNALEDIYSSSDRFIFTSLKHVNSMDNLVRYTSEAYSHIIAASWRSTDPDRSQVYFDVSQRFDACKSAILLALQEILIP